LSESGQEGGSFYLWSMKFYKIGGLLAALKYICAFLLMTLLLAGMFHKPSAND